MVISVRAARQRYAEELRFTAHVVSPAVVVAFAKVPRERFVGSGPWRIKSPMSFGDYWVTENDDPRHVYHDVLIALDSSRNINSGQPSLWAAVFDQLDVGAGKSVLHLGCGTGYYSAIVAELVGRAGKVTAVEIDRGFAQQARQSLVPWRHISVLNADGSNTSFDPVDIIIASAGATHPLPTWLDALNPNGQLLLPITTDRQWGGMLLVTRKSSDTYAARFLCPVGFIEFSGARDPGVSRRLEAAFARDQGMSVKSLCRAPREPDESCWLAGSGWWLSTADITAGQV